MKRNIILALFMTAITGCALAQESSTETIQRSFTLPDPAAPRVLEVNNVWGSIHVVGYQGQTIELSATRTNHARWKDKVELAAKEVKLDITQDKNTVRLYVNGPFRCDCNCSDCGNSGRRGNSVHMDGDLGYRVNFDFELRVPSGTRVEARTVNDGQIKIENLTGDFDLNNINGGIEMVEVAGSGRAYALNGGLKATFRSNPKTDSYFGSLNGAVDLYFQPDLSADLRFKTFNGGVYTDFTLTSLPTQAGSAERRNGKFVYRSNRFSGARVGQGGPEIKLDGFNGDIRIHQRTT